MLAAWLLVLAFAPGSASARELFGRPVHAHTPALPAELAARRAELAARIAAGELVRDGDRLYDPRTRTSRPRPSAGAAGWTEPPHDATIYLNFHGGQLDSGSIAAQMQASCVGPSGVDFPAFTGSDAEAMAMVQVFRNAMAPYSVRIAYAEPPPEHLPYSMVMMGGKAEDIGLDPGALGVSCSSDCGDVWWHDTTFAFTESSSNATELGNTALQEAAHAFGLDHIDGGEHIMYPFAGSGTKVWADSCTAYNDATGGIGCTYVHDVFCGEDSGRQNDHAELLAYFGPATPDMIAPTAELLAPADGAVFDEGVDVRVEIAVADDREGFGWRLRVVPEQGEPQRVVAYHGETTWNLQNLPSGHYTIVVEAIDHDRNEGRDEVTIQVGDGIPPALETTSEGSGTGDAGTDETGGVPASPQPSGCGCGDPRGRSWPAGIAVLVLGARRRQRTKP